ncbi:hypothetical protein GWI33_012610 [Rhynchophorus ferrugineus]|uniref:Uncharacterized protein n=1 Tax=Rhynchophorus ferrugineus TaxID=354439 RepID=A0A834I659_RHYFE|nr:hypothetical protein GWI33_012610 [Rhynchophorus ferrugineus]
MQKQFEILNEICKQFFKSPKKIESLRYIYRFNPSENWVGTRLLTIIEGKKTPLGLPSEVMDHIEYLCQQLHDEMQAHTGGDWRKFVLMLDEKGEAKTQFIYDIQSCMDEFKDD